MLYAGRKDHGKNVPQLIDFFRRYRARRGAVCELVLIGGGPLPGITAGGEGIRDLGFVSLQDKYDAYAAATLLCHPSLQESFSLVLMEAWAAKAPALVHGDCAVTREHCVRSNGGLYFTRYTEFEACLDLLLARPGLRAALGQNGRTYVLENYHWDTIVDRYKRLFAED
jgi:glycosyltransferase involved in cell wall biosynthesis